MIITALSETALAAPGGKQSDEALVKNATGGEGLLESVAAALRASMLGAGALGGGGRAGASFADLPQSEWREMSVFDVLLLAPENKVTHDLKVRGSLGRSQAMSDQIRSVRSGPATCCMHACEQQRPRSLSLVVQPLRSYAPNQPVGEGALTPPPLHPAPSLPPCTLTPRRRRSVP